jgi:two-component system, cell cycle sensor histidine kinase and response regulator CckA
MGRGRTTDSETPQGADDRFRLIAESHRALAQRLESFVNEMPLACVIWDQDARVIEWNPAASRMFGWSEAEAFQRRYSDVLGPEADSEANERLWKDLLVGTTAHRQGGARTKSRGVIECEWFHAPLLDPSGRTVGVASIVQDITERKALERQLLQSQKLEAVAILAGGIAHDFNNLLTSVLGNISLALMKLGPRHVAASGLKDAERAAERAADLTRQLLRFSRKKPAELSAVDLNQSVREVVSLLKHSVEPAVTLKTSLVADLWSVEADPGQLAQVVMNLCVNAWDAVGERGSIRLATANRQLSRRFSRGHPDARPGDFVELVVSDDGSGMDEETQLHLFEPFFTTKEPGKGTGLGLAMVYSILKQHRGWVAVSSRPRQGSTFRVYLPRTARHAAKETEDRETTAQPGTGTILLADDEDGVRKLTAAMLEHNGHRVIQAKDGEEALEAFRKARKRVRLVVLDLKMPKMSGWETFERIRSLAPQVPVILTSGCALEEEQGKARMLGAHTLLAKPYRAQTLLMAVGESLQAEPVREPV